MDWISEVKAYKALVRDKLEVDLKCILDERDTIYDLLSE
jgi:hypothetical protein